jgi:hypothetical protein
MLPNSGHAWLLLAVLVAVGACGEPNLPKTIPAAQTRVLDVEIPPTPPAASEAEQTLVQEYAVRPHRPIEEWEQEIRREWILPYKAKRIDVVLLEAVGRRDLDLLRLVLAPHAEWGPPTRHRLGARPIFGDDGGQAFFEAFHAAAMRLPAKASWRSTPVLNGVAITYDTGAEPMWTEWHDNNQPPRERIVVRKVVHEGRVVIDYVGLWKDGPPDPLPQFIDEPPAVPPIDTSRAPSGMPAPPQMPMGRPPRAPAADRP